jgi:hypothetical protein
MGCSVSSEAGSFGKNGKADSSTASISDVIDNQSVSWSPVPQRQYDLSPLMTPYLSMPGSCAVPDRVIKHVRRARGLVIRYLNLDKNWFSQAGLEFLNCKTAHSEWHTCVKRGFAAVCSCSGSRSAWNVYRGETMLKSTTPQRALAFLLNDRRCGEYDENIVESKVCAALCIRLSLLTFRFWLL